MSRQERDIYIERDIYRERDFRGKAENGGKWRVTDFDKFVGAP